MMEEIRREAHRGIYPRALRFHFMREILFRIAGLSRGWIVPHPRL